MTLNILYVGPRDGTCEHRAEALRSLGHRVTHVPAGRPRSFSRCLIYRAGNRLKRPPDLLGSNRAIVDAVRGGSVDILWIDKGLTIRRSTLARVRRDSPETRAVSYSPDDMLNPQNQSIQYLSSIPLYDLHVTTKSYNVAELRGLGARDVLFVDNAFDPQSHRPIELSEADGRKYGTVVGFVGMYEEDRAGMMGRLAESGIRVTVWGGGWARRRTAHENLVIRDEYLDGIDYAKAICATRINLGFLRKVNRDLQTTRSIEIPACGAFLLAERTDEHLRLFREGEEAEFFSSFDELLRKCRHYSVHEDERRRIARRGYQRCLRDGYSNERRLAQVLDYLARCRLRSA